MYVKELVRSSLVQEGENILLTPEVKSKMKENSVNQINYNILNIDLSSQAEKERLKTLDIESRLKAEAKVENNPDSEMVEIDTDVATEFINLNDTRYEVSVLKTSNYYINKVTEPGTIYALASMEVSLNQTSGDTILELYNPDYYEEPVKLERSKVQNIDGLNIKKVQPTNFSVSVLLQINEDGFESVTDIDGLNNLFKGIKSVKALGRKMADSKALELGVPAEKLMETSIYANNKGRIRSYIVRNLNNDEGFNSQDDYSKRSQVNKEMEDLFAEAGFTTLSPTKMNVTFKISKIHIGALGEFTTKNTRNSIYQGINYEMKEERLNGSESFSIPFFPNDSKDLIDELVKLESEFLLWSENIARVMYDYKAVNYSQNKWRINASNVVSSNLGLNKDQVSAINNKVRDQIDRALAIDTSRRI